LVASDGDLNFQTENLLHACYVKLNYNVQIEIICKRAIEADGRYGTDVSEISQNLILTIVFRSHETKSVRLRSVIDETFDV